MSAGASHLARPTNLTKKNGQPRRVKHRLAGFGLLADALELLLRALQVVGLKGGLHTGVVMAGRLPVHAVRLAQCCELRLEIRAATSAAALGRVAESLTQTTHAMDVLVLIAP